MKPGARGFITAFLRPALIALAVCGSIFLEIYAEQLCSNYARKTFNYLPLYGTRIAFCLLWAVVMRIFVALRQKNTYNGQLSFAPPAIASALVFAVIGAVDLLFLTKELIWNRLYEVLLFLSTSCIVMRREK